ncbi:MAG: hypothetical protein M3065_01945 [Actinomycetota bacterium]|nr:hypothetical protein [Actinomycetota bacterium]
MADRRHNRKQAVLAIVDNGRGFLTDADGSVEQPESHFGLRLMRDLANHAGGQLVVNSARGQGASVRLTVPLR